MRYFNVIYRASKALGVGRARSMEPLHLPERGVVARWVAPEVDLVDGDFPDYLACDVGGRVCSAAMREVLDACASSEDALQWLPLRVFRGRERRVYWVLHFPVPIDVLGGRTLRSGELVVKAVLSRARLLGHAVLTYPGSVGSLVVDGKVKVALANASCTGLMCSPAPLEP